METSESFAIKVSENDEMTVDKLRGYEVDKIAEDERESRKIEILEINSLETKVPTENQYGLQGVMRQLYDFYFVKGNSREVCYHISCSDPILIDSYLYDNKDAYERFGIYLNDGTVRDKLSYLEVVPLEVFKNHDVLFLHKYLQDKRKEAYNKGFNTIEFIIEASLDVQRSVISLNAKMLDSYIDMCNDFVFVNLDRSLLIRKDISRYLRENPVYRGKTLINILSLFVKYNCISHGVSAKDSVSRQYALIKECLQMYEEDKNIVFYCDISDTQYLAKLSRTSILSLNKVEEFMYSGIAAYLTVCGVPCYVNNVYFTRYARLICNFSDPKIMYLSDRIAYLKNPLRMGVMNALKNGNFKSIAQLQDVIDLTYQLRFVPLKPANVGEHLEIASDSVKEVKFNHRNVKIRDIRDFYTLHTMDYALAKSELDDLDGLLINAREILGIKERSLDCSNTMVFEYNGGLHLGYLTHLSYSVKYRLTPLARGYKIRNDVILNENDLHMLVDIRAYGDYTAICGKALSQDPDLLKSNLPDTTIGFLIKDAHKAAENITADTDVPFDSIALHSEVASSWRGNNIETLTQCGLPVSGLQKNFLTFFGGPVPYHGDDISDNKARLNIGPELWR